MSKMSFSTRT